MRYFKFVSVLLLLVLLSAGCNSGSTAKTAEDNFKELSAGLFGEKAQTLYADIQALAADISSSSDADLDSSGAGIVSVDSEAYRKLLDDAFGAYTTEACMKTIAAKRLYFPMAGSVDSISFEPATDLRTNYTMKVTLQDADGQAHSFDLSGSFQYDENGKITYFDINALHEFGEFVAANQGG